jgi:hypothetical protein
MIPGVNYDDPAYEVHLDHCWLARIAVENLPGIDPDTDVGREELGAYAYAIFRKNAAIQHVLIMQAGEVVGAAYRGIGGVEGARLQ